MSPSLNRAKKKHPEIARIGNNLKEIFLTLERMKLAIFSLIVKDLVFIKHDNMIEMNTNTALKSTRLYICEFKSPKRYTAPVTNKGPDTHPNVFEQLRSARPNPLFLAEWPTKASLGAPNSPFDNLSKILDPRINTAEWKRSIILLRNAIMVAVIKIFFLFLILSKRLPLTRRNMFAINSVPPSIKPNTSSDKPSFSVVSKGSMVIATVVAMARRKFIIII